MGNAANILIGTGTLYYGEKDAANTGFSDVGYTRGGVNLERTGTFHDVDVDQEFSPVLTFMSAERMVVRTNLAEATQENLKLAWGLSDAITSSDFSDVDGNSYSGNAVQFGGPGLTEDLPEYSIIFKGKAPGTDKVRLIRFHRCIAVDFGNIVHQKNAETVVPAAFLCLADSNRPNNKRVGVIYDESD